MHDMHVSTSTTLTVEFMRKCSLEIAGSKFHEDVLRLAG
jgi:hypothetical protein